MNNFTYSIPTVIHFGKGMISHLTELTESGKNVLLVYGGGSIKRSGLYDTAKKILSDVQLVVTELPGVEPNPRIETVRRGVKLCKENNIDMVLAIGGGSTIDCAKVVAAGAKYDGDAWDLVLDGSKITAALPVYSVLTLSATGSEMDEFAVISDLSKNEKWGTGSDLVKPKMSILDPEYTYTVSPKQTSAGTADMMSHIFENYFTNVKGAAVQARLCEGLLKTLIQYAPIALKHPTDYEARANLMWVGSLAINGLLSDGADVTWCVHPMEHELSAFYDITHGEGLAILTPFWMDFALNEQTAAKFAEYGRNVWNLSIKDDDMTVAKQAIACTREFFKKMNLPASLHEVGIDDTYFDIMAQKAADGSVGSFVPLSKEDIISIFRAAL
ncbi:MAG: iron-containing alcohol dehydrogenase [Clostridiales bacterium]|nr:iron-containing alcohol dehydrogenase [Clostridiales bacterium]